MKASFIATGEESGNTLKLAQPPQPYSTVPPTEDPFFKDAKSARYLSDARTQIFASHTISISLH